MTNKKRTGLDGELSLCKRVVKWLQPYYKKGNRWFKLRTVKRKQTKSR